MARSLPMGVEVQVEVELGTYMPYRIHRLSVLTSMRDAFARDNRTIKIREWRVMMVLASFGPLTITEISDRLWADAASTTRAVQMLIRDGLAVSRTSRTDKRKQIVTLTEQGAAVYDSIMPRRMAFSENILSIFSDEERATLFNLIDRMESHLAGMTKAEDDPFDGFADE